MASEGMHVVAYTCSRHAGRLAELWCLCPRPTYAFPPLRNQVRYCPVASHMQGNATMEHAPTTTERTRVSSDSSIGKEELLVGPEAQRVKETAHDDDEGDAARARGRRIYAYARRVLLGGLAAVILGWWITSTVLPATRHRWYVALPCLTRLLLPP